MLTLGALLLLAVAASASSSPYLHPLSDDYIARINSIQTTWKAARNFRIEDWDRVKKIASGSWKTPDSIKKVDRVIHDASETVPESFDAREAWPECVEFIGQIRDQSACGACWAFGAAEAMSDRLCIHSNGTVRKYISAEDLSSCCDYCGDGCNGGIPYNAWAYWEDSGIVSGGSYQSNQGCKDFSLAPCEHHTTDEKVACEDLTGYNTPACVRTCYDSSIDYDSDLTFGQDPVFLWDEKQIQLEIYKNGPVEAGFTVFEDFLSYKSGIYQATTEEMVGSHAVKMIGWGVEDGVKYWLIVNSWNSDWGADGYVKFIRGEDSCGIESEVTAALPRY